MEAPSFKDKIVIVLEKGLLPWQELNVTAFLASCIASHFPETMGKDFVDASSVSYLGMFRQPVMVFEATTEEIKNIYKKSRERELHIGIYPRKIFETQGDQNLEAVAVVKEEDHDIVGLVIFGSKNKVDKTLDGLELHR